MNFRLISFLLIIQMIPSFNWPNDHLLAQNEQPLSNSKQAGQNLVLKNGNVLRGIVQRTASHYHVHTPQGNRLIVPLKDAEFVVDHLEQAYWIRLSTLRATDFEGQELLFYWCLKYELLEAAQNQLEILQSIGMKEQQLHGLKKRMDKTFAEKTPQAAGPSWHSTEDSGRGVSTGTNARQAVADWQPSAPSWINENFFRNLDPVLTPLPPLEFAFDRPGLAMIKPEFHQPLPQSQPINPTAHPLQPLSTDSIPSEASRFGIRQVTYDQLESEDLRESGQFGDAFTETRSTDPNWAKSISQSALSSHDLSSTDLTVFIKSLPAGSFQAFRQRLERHLILQCGDCHRRNSPDLSVMPLMFTGKHQPINARMSQRNLHSVMAQINLGDPERSPILLAAKTAHGGTLHPPYNEQSREYQMLKTWVQLMAQEWKSDSHPHPHRDSTLPMPLHRNQPQPDFGSPSKPGALLKPLASAVSTQNNNLPIPKTDRLAAPPGEIPKLNAFDESFKPKDEFDPEIFNRKHF